MLTKGQVAICVKWVWHVANIAIHRHTSVTCLIHKTFICQTIILLMPLLVRLYNSLTCIATYWPAILSHSSQSSAHCSSYWNECYMPMVLHYHYLIIALHWHQHSTLQLCHKRTIISSYCLYNEDKQSHVLQNNYWSLNNYLEIINGFIISNAGAPSSCVFILRSTVFSKPSLDLSDNLLDAIIFHFSRYTAIVLLLLQVKCRIGNFLF